MKGIRVSIFRDARLGPCSNGGISERVDQVTLVDADGPFEATPEAPAVRLVKRVIGGEAIITATPVVEHESMACHLTGKETACGPMMGGSYIACSDSRFGKAVRALGGNGYGAVALHDRFETWAEHEALSL